MGDDWGDNASAGERNSGSWRSRNANSSQENDRSNRGSAWGDNKPSFDSFSRNQNSNIPSQQFSRSRGEGGSGGGGGGGGYRGSRDGDRFGNSRNYNQDRRDDNFEVTYVPSSKVGKVIGRGGSKINELQGESGARIQVTKDTEGEDTIVKLFGDEASIARAKELIEQLLFD